jgi:hypothetical protein
MTTTALTVSYDQPLAISVLTHLKKELPNQGIELGLTDDRRGRNGRPPMTVTDKIGMLMATHDLTFDDMDLLGFICAKCGTNIGELKGFLVKGYRPEEIDIAYRARDSIQVSVIWILRFARTFRICDEPEELAEAMLYVWDALRATRNVYPYPTQAIECVLSRAKALRSKHSDFRSIVAAVVAEDDTSYDYGDREDA